MLFRSLAGSLAVVCLWCQSASAELVTGFDVVVGGNLNLQGRILGRTLVAGNVTTGFPSFGGGLTPRADYANTDVLVVGGSLQSNGITMEAGDVRLGGTRGSAGVNLNGPGSQLFQNDASAVAQSTGIGQRLQSLSTLYASVDANSTWSLQGSTVTFHAAPGADGIAVFDVPASLLTLQNANFLLPTAGLSSATSYVFNVLGEVTGTPMGNFGQNFLTPSIVSHALWNFADQTSDLSLTREWYGSILIPNAGLATTGAVNGGVYVGGDFTSNGEVRLPSYAGALPSAVPEPSSMVLAGAAGLGFLGARLRRRKANAKEIKTRSTPAGALGGAGVV